MKKFSLIIGLLVLVSCKTSKHSGCDAYGNTYLIRKDSMIVKVDHCHIEKEHYCHYNVDTFYLTNTEK